MKKLILSLTVLSVAFANGAAAANKSENRGVFGGAIVGAAAGGPIGLIVGAAIGGHYAHVRERAKTGEGESQKLAGQLGERDAQLDQALGNVGSVSRELLRAQTQIASLNGQLDALSDDQLTLTKLSFNVLFRTDDASIGEADKARLELLSRVLKRHPEFVVRLHGHADVRGADEHNDNLALQRVFAVADTLAGLDVSSERIQSFAYGARQASAVDGDVDGYATDRRVSIQFERAGQPSTAVANND